MVEQSNVKEPPSTQGTCRQAYYLDGGRCHYVLTCDFAGKKDCKAIESEIKFLEENLRITEASLIHQISRLKSMKE